MLYIHFPRSLTINHNKGENDNNAKATNNLVATSNVVCVGAVFKRRNHVLAHHHQYYRVACVISQCLNSLTEKNPWILALLIYQSKLIAIFRCHQSYLFDSLSAKFCCRRFNSFKFTIETYESCKFEYAKKWFIWKFRTPVPCTCQSPINTRSL